jgi:inner membrane protein
VDNLTHSLAGLIMGDAALALQRRSSSPASSHYPAAVLTTGVLANNAPDFDFAYVGITAGKLGYLLHHRGHTHTLLGVLLLGLLVLALVGFGFRLRKRPLARSELVQLALLALLGGLLHVLMDYGNNYGVHPFWPLYDGWFYGDAIFIIDPWLLIVLIGVALCISASRLLRGGLLLGLFGVLGLAWGVRTASASLAGMLTAFALIWVGGLWGASYRRRTWAGGGALALLWLALLGTRYVARASVRDALEQGDPGLQLADLVSTPFPGNPLCWSVLALTHSEDEYVVRQAVASGWPALFSVTRCRPMNDGQTAPVVPASLGGAAPDGARLAWGPEFRAPRAELAQLRAESCVARAFLRFARVPFWIQRGERASLIGDLRFDRSSAIEFAELPLVPDAPCPRHEPPWLPPVSID